MDFTRSHGLGNDYLIVDGRIGRFEPTIRAVTHLCDRHRGVGSDGVLVHVDPVSADFGVRIFNPDGSEAEKSGNGLRIFAHYLWAQGHSTGTSFTMETFGGAELTSAVVVPGNDGAVDIEVDMGVARFASAAVPTTLTTTDAIDAPLSVGGTELMVTAVSVGNPHCVIFVDDLDGVDIRGLGPAIERHPAFPNRTNVQFAKVLSHDRIAVEIWERGAGYTLASGSSACAVAAAAVKTGRAGSAQTIVMAGGSLSVEVDKGFGLRQRGPVEEIARGRISPSLARAMGVEPPGQDPGE